MTTDKNLSMTPDTDKAPQRRKRPRKGPIIGFLLLLFLLAGIGAGAWWYLFLRFEESTDDAYVAGNVLRIMPQVGGKVVAVDVDDNDMVAAGQTLVRLDPVDARLAYERSLVALASAVRDNCRLQAQLRETEAAIRMRRVDLRQKADNLTRREALGKAKAIGAEELKHARDDRENAAVALAAAEEERNALSAVLLDTGVAKGTLYLHFGDKEGLFNGLAESAFAPMHALAKEILDDKTPTLREKLLRFCGPMLDEQGCSRTARIIRLVWAEGLHNPKLVAPFYHGLVAPILELHRENLRLAAHEHPHPALQRFPQLLVSPIMQGLLWQGMFKDKAPLDVKELYIAYLDIILPEK